MGAVPRRTDVVRQLHGVSERLRHAELALARSSLEPAEMFWRTVGGPGEPAFQGAWANYEFDPTAGPVGFARHPVSGALHLRGACTTREPDWTPPDPPANHSALVFQLPVGYRPAVDTQVPTAAFASGMVIVVNAYPLVEFVVRADGWVQVPDPPPPDNAFHEISWSPMVFDCCEVIVSVAGAAPVG